MKPKENTIAKIDALFQRIYESKFFDLKKDGDLLNQIKDLQEHIHSMNLHKAKVSYFATVKSKLNEIVEKMEMSNINLNDLKESIYNLKKYT